MRVLDHMGQHFLRYLRDLIISWRFPSRFLCVSIAWKIGLKHSNIEKPFQDFACKSQKLKLCLLTHIGERHALLLSELCISQPL